MRKPKFLSSTRALFLIAAAGLVMVLAACGGGGGSSTAPAVSITISPTTATLAAGATQQFTATVSNASSTAVGWQVNGVTGGNASVGTISTGGLYTAPAVAPTPNTVTVTAIAIADTTKTAAATVTVQQASGLVISPTTANVATGTTLKFTAAIDGTSTNAVNWLVNGIAGGNSTVGNIDTTGGYTAPATIPNPATVTVSAVSQADSTKQATASVTIVHFTNASLKGTFTFLMTGADSNGSFNHGGVFFADGNGQISAATDEYVQGSQALLNKTFSGSYSIAQTGAGTIHMDTAAGPFDLAFVMSGSDYAYFIESDGYGNASGSIQRQDAAAFSNTAISGNYVFALSGAQGSGTSAFPIATAGRFAAGGGSITSGLEDINNGSAFTPLQPLSGTYSIGTNGRGTGTFVTGSTTTQMVFYVIDANTIRLFSADPNLPVTGRAEKQTSVLTTATFNGSYVLSSSGSFVSSGFNPVNALTLYNVTGSGASSGSRDEMLNGTANLQLPFSGTYTVDSNGRLISTTTDTNRTSNQVAWFVNPQRAFVLFADTFRVESGILEQQTGATFSSTSLNGAYGFSMAGVDYGNKTAGEFVDTTGTLLADGNGALSIAKSTNRNGTNSTASLTGSYNVAATGRGIASFSDGSNVIFYVVNDSKVDILQSDRFTQISGGARKQY